MAAPQRRCRDPLGPRANEVRYAAPSQHAACYLEGSLALRERTGQECLAAHLNAKTAAAASHAPLYSLEPTASVAADMNTWGEGMAESRRGAIRYLFEAALASSLIPLVTSPGLGAAFRGMRVCDGGLLNNCPTFADGARRQLKASGCSGSWSVCPPAPRPLLHVTL